MKLSLHVDIVQTKPSFSGSDWEAILQWVMDNIVDKLPTDASATYHFSITS